MLPGYVLNRVRGAFVPTFTYAEAFRDALRAAWAEAKADAARAALPAPLPLPAAAAPISFRGNQYAAALDTEAAALRRAARAA